MSETYQQTYQCDNCSHVGPIDILKGTLKPEVAECSNCGCKTAKPRMAVEVTVTAWGCSPDIYADSDIGMTLPPVECPHPGIN